LKFAAVDAVFLLVTIQVDLNDRLALALQDDLTAQIVDSHTRGVLIDISALDVMDSFGAWRRRPCAHRSPEFLHAA
jgi:anti-anti-sigma regulatory factor